MGLCGNEDVRMRCENRIVGMRCGNEDVRMGLCECDCEDVRMGLRECWNVRM